MNRAFFKGILVVLAAVLIPALFFASEKTYKVGDIGPGGGIVFYKNSSGFSVDNGSGESKICHYLEVSKEDVGCASWAPRSLTAASASTRYGIGEGMAATQDILNSAGQIKKLRPEKLQ